MTTATNSPSAFQKSTFGEKAAATDDRDDDNDAVELLGILREMIANRQKFPELRKTCVQFFERKMMEDGGGKDEGERTYSIPPRICLDCVEILEDERRVREEENDDDKGEYEEEDEFYDRNWGQEESFCDDDEEEAAPKASMKEIESERILLQFVIIESCTRATNVREAYIRNWFELKNITRSRVRCEKSRRRAANLVYFAADIDAQHGQGKNLAKGLTHFDFLRCMEQSQQKRPAPRSRPFLFVKGNGLEAQTFVFLFEL